MEYDCRDCSITTCNGCPTFEHQERRSKLPRVKCGDIEGWFHGFGYDKVIGKGKCTVAIVEDTEGKVHLIYFGNSYVMKQDELCFLG
jgi:hypothetical protein